MNSAHLVFALEWDTDSALYELEPPLPVGDESHRYLVLSAQHPINGDHGCIALASNAAGEVTSWEPVAARTDSTSHADLLALLGYEVQP